MKAGGKNKILEKWEIRKMGGYMTRWTEDK
jgi:hypothetical protein